MVQPKAEAVGEQALEHQAKLGAAVDAFGFAFDVKADGGSVSSAITRGKRRTRIRSIALNRVTYPGFEPVRAGGDRGHADLAGRVGSD